MNITLTPEQEQFVLEEIRSGRAKSAKEVIGCRLEFLRAHDPYINLNQNRERLRREIDIGIQQADRGDLYDREEVFTDLLAKIRKRKKRRAMSRYYRLTWKACADLDLIETYISRDNPDAAEIWS